MRELLIDRKDIRHARFADAPPRALQDGKARLRLDLFSLTSNNITYAAMGEGMLGYWDFFPASEGMGKPPCWGFATVVESRAPGVAEGMRVYGYFPVAETLDVTPARANKLGFSDAAAHRAAKAPIYNQYQNVESDPAYDPAFEAEQALFRPLYGTGWWAADCVHERAPASVIITSASSKTALALAHKLRALGGMQVVGLTSAANLAFVAGTGLYDRVLDYGAVQQLTAAGPVTLVDFLGRRDIMQRAGAALGRDLTRIIIIGATDWTALSGVSLPAGGAPGAVAAAGPAPEFFFVPDYAARRLKETPDLGRSMMVDMKAFYGASRDLVTARRGVGEASVLEGWGRLVSGEAPPSEGIVLTFAGA